MRYKPEHKDRTRDRIVRESGRLFRRHGYEGTGIDAIMATVGLTRGGFYGYFRSKAALFAEVMADEHDFVERMRARDAAGRRDLTRQGLEVIAGYLAPENRERVARGCPLASLSVDVARANRAVRREYASKVGDLAAELARGLADAEPTDPRALAVIALCVGGLVVSRALGDDPLADRMSAACLDAVGERLTG